MRKFPRILFFIASTIATDDENDEAFGLGPNVAFRNASLVSQEGALEPCDGVAGMVPARYADKYPTAHDAISEWQTHEMERRSRRAAGLPPAIEPEDTPTQAATAPPGSAKASLKGQAAAKDTTAAPAAAAGWKANT